MKCFNCEAELKEGNDFCLICRRKQTSKKVKINYPNTNKKSLGLSGKNYTEGDDKTWWQPFTINEGGINAKVYISGTAPTEESREKIREILGKRDVWGDKSTGKL